MQPDPLLPAEQFESAYFARKIFPLVEKLSTEYGGEWKFQVKDIGLLFKQMSFFFEKHLGKHSIERKFPRLPAGLFKDTRENGSVLFILKKYHEYLKSHSLPRLSFDDPSQLDKNMEFIGWLREELINSSWLKFPIVFVDPATGDEKDELEGIVREMGGTVATTSADPAVTHIVHPFGPEGDPDDGVQYLRPLEERPGEFLVHFWYFPDSYDNWMTAEAAPDNLEPDHKPIGPWKVYLRWLRDTKKFNEWMNPIDYETEEFQEEQDALQDQADNTQSTSLSQESPLEPLAALEEDDEEEDDSNSDEDVDSVAMDDKLQLKRKHEALTEFLSGPTDLLSDQKKFRDDNHKPEVDESASERISENVVRHKATNLPPEPISGATQNISVNVVSETSVDPAIEETDCFKQLYTVPVHASWFDWDHVHQVEVDGVPVKSDLVADGVDAQFYMTCRNEMIDRFREKPNRLLSLAEVQRKLNGSRSDLHRIYTFLAKWGLINYFPAASKRAKRSNQEDGTSMLLPSPAPPLIHFSNSVTLPELDSALTQGNELAYALLNKPNKYGRTVTEATSGRTEIRCSAMPWIECTETYYHCIKMPDIDLCPQAYSEGRFPAGTCSKDYIKVIPGSKEEVDANGWTDHETLLLLEAIEMYKDNWAEIAEHVGSKSALQCAMHWLTMSIDDGFVDEVLDMDSIVGQGLDKELAKTLPFADVKNPVMAQVACLSVLVGPEVAATAASEALNALSKEDPDVSLDDLSTTMQIDKEEQMDIEKMREAAAKSLRAAAAKSRLLAEKEERDMERILLSVMKAQLKKNEIKMSKLSEIDNELGIATGRLRAARQQMTLQRDSLMARGGHQRGQGHSMDNGIREDFSTNGH